MNGSAFYLTIFIFISIGSLLGSVSGANNPSSWQASVTVFDNGNSLEATIYYQYNSNFSLVYANGITETETYPANLPDGLKWEGCPETCAAFPYSLGMAKMHIAGPGDFTALSGGLLRITGQTDPSWDVTGYFDTSSYPAVPTQIFLKGGPQHLNRTFNFNSIIWGTDTSNPDSWSSSNPFILGGTCVNQTIQCYSIIDILLVLDESGSISAPDWVTVKNFAVQLVNAFPAISVDAVMIGVVTFDNLGYLKFPLSGNRQALVDGITALVQSKGETNTSGGIDVARQELARSRSNVSDLMIVLTDGNANIPNNFALAISAVN